MGVKAVVVAEWEVEDEPAKLFTTTFYESKQIIFMGNSMIRLKS